MSLSKEELRLSAEKDFEDGITGIGLIIMLTRILKNLHTKLAIFVSSGIVPFFIGFLFWYFYQFSILKCITISMTSHIVGFVFTLSLFNDLDEKYAYFKEYERILKEIRDREKLKHSSAKE
jgi:hypothetical protein